MPSTIEIKPAVVADNVAQQVVPDAKLPARSEFLRQRSVLAVVPFSRATLWRRVKDRSFPQPVKLSKGISVWRADEIRAWLLGQRAIQ